MTPRTTALPVDDLELLQEAQRRGRRRLAAANPVPVPPPAPPSGEQALRALVPSLVPPGGLRDRQWVCGKCQRPYLSISNLLICPACTAGDEAAALGKAREEARAHALRLMVEGGGCDFLDATFANRLLARRISPREALLEGVRCRDLVYDEEQDLWPAVTLVGGTGTGKTTLGTAIFHWHLERALSEAKAPDDRHLRAARSCLWVPAKALCYARREEGLGKKIDLIDAANRAPVLLIDDLGQGASVGREDVEALIRDRRDRRQRTIITTGFSMVQIEASYGAQIARRLTERAHLIKLEKAVTRG